MTIDLTDLPPQLETRIIQPMAKADHLNTHNAAAFGEGSVAKAYTHRPVYPPATFTLLANLMPNPAGRVLDAGCGTGFIARNLASLVGQVDALDLSPAMIEEGKNAPNGNRSNLNWIVGKAEQLPPNPPYGLITAGESLHWMDWDVVLPLFSNALEAGGVLALLEPLLLPLPWDTAIKPLIGKYSTVQNYQPLDLMAALEQRQLFCQLGHQTLEPQLFRQPLTNYIESFHGRASLCRERMGADNATCFDEAVRALVEPYSGDEVELWVGAQVVWGLPLLAP
jgi:SAM-dependent methyltransferase